jgi:hypothetical protein
VSLDDPVQKIPDCGAEGLQGKASGNVIAYIEDKTQLQIATR